MTSLKNLVERAWRRTGRCEAGRNRLQVICLSVEKILELQI